jgi:hypothetical protein
MTPPVHQRGTFDEDRERRVPCYCGRRVTGQCWAISAAGCPFDQSRLQARPLGRWGVLWPDVDREMSE